MAAVARKTPIGFLDLPAEIRDMIYIYSRSYSWIDITGMPDKINPPSVARVSRQVRKECLDVFYGQNRFMLDMRGWKHADYPQSWTPADIFNTWITAIGDKNAARIRHLSFYLTNFAVHFTVDADINAEQPRIRCKFRQTLSSKEYIDVAEDAPPGYCFEIASHRAHKRLAYVVKKLSQEIGLSRLTSANVRALFELVEELQPALCTRPSVGWKGAIFPPLESMETDGHTHRSSCAECKWRNFRNLWACSRTHTLLQMAKAQVTG